MNIVTICYPTAGGSGVVATELALSLSGRGHRVDLVAGEKPIRLRDQSSERITFHPINVPSYDLFPDASYGMAAACTIRQVLAEREVDVVHAHYAFPHALSAYMASDLLDREGVPIVTTLHGTDIFMAEDHPCHYDIVRSSLERSTAVTAVSEFLKNEAKRIFGTGKEITVIPNFVDANRFRPRTANQRQDAKKRYCSPETSLLVHISNFRSIKRSEDMIRVLRYMREAGQETHLMMIGDGPERERVKGLLGEFHMREHATWVDPVDDIQTYLSAADLLVVTSERESFSMSALEAMACGLPVINAAQGGIRELVRDGVDGYHVDDLYELAEKAAGLFQDRNRYRSISESARKRVENHYATERVVPQYEQLYADVVGAGRN